MRPLGEKDCLPARENRSAPVPAVRRAADDPRVAVSRRRPPHEGQLRVLDEDRPREPHRVGAPDAAVAIALQTADCGGREPHEGHLAAPDEEDVRALVIAVAVDASVLVSIRSRGSAGGRRALGGRVTGRSDTGRRRGGLVRCAAGGDGGGGAESQECDERSALGHGDPRRATHRGDVRLE